MGWGIRECDCGKYIYTALIKLNIDARITIVYQTTVKTKTLLSIVASLFALVLQINAADIQNGKLGPGVLNVEATILTYTPASSLVLKTFASALSPSGSAIVKFKVGGVVKYEATMTNGADKIILGFGDGLQFSGSETITVTITPIANGSTSYTTSLFFQ